MNQNQTRLRVLFSFVTSSSLRVGGYHHVMVRNLDMNRDMNLRKRNEFDSLKRYLIGCLVIGDCWTLIGSRDLIREVALEGICDELQNYPSDRSTRSLIGQIRGQAWI